MFGVYWYMYICGYVMLQAFEVCLFSREEITPGYVMAELLAMQVYIVPSVPRNCSLSDLQLANLCTC